jgi:hypothetical protein
MKIIISENKRDRFILKWLEDNYGNLKYKTPENDPTWFYYIKDGQVELDYLSEYKRLTFSDDILTFLQKYVGYNYLESKSIVRIWFENSYKLDVEVVATPVDIVYSNWEFMSYK